MLCPRMRAIPRPPALWGRGILLVLPRFLATIARPYFPG
jgi:hypothetical protein